MLCLIRHFIVVVNFIMTKSLMPTYVQLQLYSIYLKKEMINLTTVIHSLNSDYSTPFRSLKPFLQRNTSVSQIFRMKSLLSNSVLPYSAESAQYDDLTLGIIMSLCQGIL